MVDMGDNGDVSDFLSWELHCNGVQARAVEWDSILYNQQERIEEYSQNILASVYKQTKMLYPNKKKNEKGLKVELVQTNFTQLYMMSTFNELDN
jgi:hypothetical protein